MTCHMHFFDRFFMDSVKSCKMSEKSDRFSWLFAAFHRLSWILTDFHGFLQIFPEFGSFSQVCDTYFFGCLILMDFETF